MSKSDNVTLESLCGLRVLDGRGSFVLGPGERPDDYSSENASVVVLRLDGVCYWFQEDPSDGYRSDLGFVRRFDARPEMPLGSFVEFAPIMVTMRVRTKPASEWSARDCVLYAVDERTGLVLFEIGTENLDDYYPSFVHTWTPEGASPAWLAGALDAATSRS